MKKYELTSETKIVFGHILYRIKALSSFGCVSAGDVELRAKLEQVKRENETLKHALQNWHEEV